MTRLMATVAALALIAAQTTASAATKETPKLIKASVACGAPVKAKLAKAPRVENRCESDDRGPMGIGVAPLVFGGAAVAGIVAIAVSTTGNNNNATSP